MQIGLNNYQSQANFGSNKIKINRNSLKNTKEILNNLKHEMPAHTKESAVDFYKNMGFAEKVTLPNGITIHFPKSLKEMEAIIAKDALK